METEILNLITFALWLKNALHERKDNLVKDGSRGEKLTLENANTALAELLERYKTGEWKAPANGNNIPKIEEV